MSRHRAESPPSAWQVLRQSRSVHRSYPNLSYCPNVRKQNYRSPPTPGPLQLAGIDRNRPEPASGPTVRHQTWTRQHTASRDRTAADDVWSRDLASGIFHSAAAGVRVKIMLKTGSFVRRYVRSSYEKQQTWGTQSLSFKLRGLYNIAVLTDTSPCIAIHDR